MRAILTYHSIDDSGSAISVSRTRFASDVASLAASQVPVVSVEQLLQMAPGASGVAITFDDAFANFASHAWPILRDRGYPVTLFVPTRFVGATNRWSALAGASMPTLPILGWPELGSLAADGVALGAHSRTHADLRRLDTSELDEEVGGSVEDIVRETGCIPAGFAYPYGAHDGHVVARVRPHVAWACTTMLAPLRSGADVHCLPRLDAYFLSGPARLTAYGTGIFSTYITLRAGIRRLRRS